MAISDVSYDVITIGILFVVTILIFLLIIFIFAFCLRSSNEESIASAAPLASGLSVAAIASLPLLAFRAGDFEEGVECVVCLSEIAEGEAVHKLPQCGHVFHVACINVWFYSHCTCPLCRSAVTAEEHKVANSSIVQSVEPSPISENAPEASAGDSSCSHRREEEVVIQIR